MISTKLEWKEKMAFEADVNEHKLRIDVPMSGGGQNTGPTPKQLLLTAVAGCTGLDVVSILNKMRLKIASFSIDANASVADEYPAVFEKVKLNYRLSGTELKAEKVIIAVEKSQTKYCAISAMVAKTAKIEYEIFLNNQSIATGQSHFA